MEGFLIAARFLHFSAVMVLTGVFAFERFVADPTFRQSSTAPASARGLCRRLGWLAWTSLALAVGSGAVWLVMVAAGMSGKPLGAVLLKGVVPIVLTRTQFGEDWLLRLVMAVLLGLCLLGQGRRRWWVSGAIGWTAFLLASAMLVSLAWAGHGAATPGSAGDRRGFPPPAGRGPMAGDASAVCAAPDRGAADRRCRLGGGRAEGDPALFCLGRRKRDGSPPRRLGQHLVPCRQCPGLGRNRIWPPAARQDRDLHRHVDSCFGQSAAAFTAARHCRRRYWQCRMADRCAAKEKRADRRGARARRPRHRRRARHLAAGLAHRTRMAIPVPARRRCADRRIADSIGDPRGDGLHLRDRRRSFGSGRALSTNGWIWCRPRPVPGGRVDAALAGDRSRVPDQLLHPRRALCRGLHRARCLSL